MDNSKNTPVPSVSQWEELIKLAAEFRKLEPWKWMGDDELFGVQDPESGEIGYCVCMGMIQQMYGLAVYRGSEGLNIIKSITSGRLQSGEKAMINTYAYMLEFINKTELENAEKDLFKTLGYAPRGRKMYPVFRDFQPGYFPWFINAQAARFLAHVLEQAITICTRSLDDEDLLEPHEDGYYFVRVPSQKGDSIVWKDAWMKPARIRKKKQDVTVDSSRQLKIMNAVKKRSGVIELDSFYQIPAVIDAEPRPYFANIISAVDHHSGLALHQDIASPENYPEKVHEVLFTVIENGQTIPVEILVSKKEVADILKPIAEALRIKVTIKKHLKEITNMRRAMRKYFER